MQVESRMRGSPGLRPASGTPAGCFAPLLPQRAHNPAGRSSIVAQQGRAVCSRRSGSAGSPNTQHKQVHSAGDSQL